MFRHNDEKRQDKTHFENGKCKMYLSILLSYVPVNQNSFQPFQNINKQKVTFRNKQNLCTSKKKLSPTACVLKKGKVMSTVLNHSHGI